MGGLTPPHPADPWYVPDRSSLVINTAWVPIMSFVAIHHSKFKYGSPLCTLISKPGQLKCCRKRVTATAR